MYEQIKPNIHHSFSGSLSRISYWERSVEFMQPRGQILLDIWPVSVSMSVFMTPDYLLRGESHVDPSAL